jgi:hypothetical protein
MKILHFVDAAGSDETFFPAADCISIRVASTSSVELYFAAKGDVASDKITLTTTVGKSDEVGLKMAEYIHGGGMGHAGIHKFIAATAPIADVSTIAFAAGA